MKTAHAATLLPLAALSLSLVSFASVAPATRAEDSDNDTIAAMKKAALVVEGKGIVSVVPTFLYVSVEVSTEGKGLDSLKAQNTRNVDALHAALTRQGIQASNTRTISVFQQMSYNSYTDVTNTPNLVDSPGDVYKVVRNFTFSASTPAKTRQALLAMRTLNLPARAEVMLSLANTKEENDARRVALKAAVADATDQAQVFGEAAKPKTFELVFAKEGEFQAPSQKWYIPLDSPEPLPALDAIAADASVTVFYGLVSPNPNAPVKPAKVAVTPAAGKAAAKTKTP